MNIRRRVASPSFDCRRGRSRLVRRYRRASRRSRSRSRSSRPSARPARTSSGCRRRRSWSRRCSTWPQVTPQDVVMDLGLGRRPQHHRRRQARRPRGRRRVQPRHGRAVEPPGARKPASPDKATFVEGDMYAADISKATVMALFLLPDNLDKLRDKFLALQAGHAHRAQHVRDSRLGSRTSPRRSRATARAGARRCSTSSRPRWPARGRRRRAS